MLKTLLRELPVRAPDLIAQVNIPPAGYDDLLKMAVESMRGTQGADPAAKRRFVGAVLDHMQSVGAVSGWEFIGSRRRQDYRVNLPDGTPVCIEQKGCGDGNNTTIWDRPTWAQEFIIWSLCQDSLQYHPGHGVWSAISTRLVPKIIHERQAVDAFILYDARCGSDLRPCPKAYGVHGVRARATDIEGQSQPAVTGGGSGVGWLPPPSIYLFPRSVPDAPSNPSPPPHTATTCRFAHAMLTAFGVPDDEMANYVHRVHASVELRADGVYRKVVINHGQEPLPILESPWRLVRR